MQISPEMFLRWKEDEVTKTVMDVLLELRKQVELEMLDDWTILSPNFGDRIQRLAGIREGLDKILNIDIEQPEEKDDVDYE